MVSPVSTTCENVTLIPGGIVTVTLNPMPVFGGIMTVTLLLPELATYALCVAELIARPAVVNGFGESRVDCVIYVPWLGINVTKSSLWAAVHPLPQLEIQTRSMLASVDGSTATAAGAHHRHLPEVWCSYQSCVPIRLYAC